MGSAVAEGRLESMQVYKLLQYVRERDKPQIEKMVRLGVPNLINLSEPKEGLTALHQASMANDGDMVRFLLSVGAFPDSQDKTGRTPVMLATQLGLYDIVELLASKGADMKVVDAEGRGVLFYCIQPTEAHLRCQEVALRNGADANNASFTGKPVLVQACEQADDCETMCLHLLEKGADPDNVDEETGHTALMEAARVGALNVVREILQDYGKVNDLDHNKCHATHFAAEGGFLEVLQLLSAYSADPGTVSADGSTPLHYAAAGGFADCCRFLAQRGCNPKLKNAEGLVARQIAKNCGHKAALKELKKAETLQSKLEAGEANPNQPWALTLHDWSVEHEAKLRAAFAMEADEDDEGQCSSDLISKNTFLSVLEENGAPAEPEQLEKIFAAHDKKREGRMNVNDFFKGLEYLQKAYVASSYLPKKKKKAGKGGKGKKKGKFVLPLPICMVPPDHIHRRDDGGPPHYMIERHLPFTDTNRFDRDQPPGHPIEDDSAWYLDEPETAFININHCVKKGDLESLSLAFSHRVPVDVTDRYYKTPLMTACISGNYEVAKFLIGQGADVNASDQFSWTPLHHACQAGQADIVDLLVRAGAELDPVAMNGSTPLMRAIESCRLGCVEHLLNAGADMGMMNKKEQNCMDIAKAYGDLRIINLIQEMIDSPVESKEIKRQKSSSPQEQSKTEDEVTDEVPEEPPSPSPVPPLKLPLRDSVVFQNSRINSGAASKVNITYVPKNIWSTQPTRGPLIPKTEEPRVRVSDSVDTEDVTVPADSLDE
ncbi:ankyrin repeat and EF-hand domain-containing protein 1 [Megalops cyprinoides]|uniref:ankyrin repeat and EF-hand domain-containing protein 1 n=1 Tax=Megalops cyprinoides TaxID=118141 RepID=UPI001863FEFD|nr:ankyrin repeat and EF-hand domain-containing protein 1 [Megalops cyprinoides]